jgi:hypothetical protein
MKFSIQYILYLTLFLSLTSCNSKEEGKHLFILSGQSNMARLIPKESFTPTLEAKFGKENIIVVKVAKGTQPIRRWYKQWKPLVGNTPKPNPILYNRLMDQLKIRTFKL